LTNAHQGVLVLYTAQPLTRSVCTAYCYAVIIVGVPMLLAAGICWLAYIQGLWPCQSRICAVCNEPLKPGQKRVYPENTVCARHKLKMVHEWCGNKEEGEAGAEAAGGVATRGHAPRRSESLA
jgi:hypothetical protein